MEPEDGTDIERRLESFIVDELIEERYDGRDPLAAEAVDSLGFEQLAEYIEEEFSVRIEDQEMVRENFESVPALAALVREKREGAGG
jgi:acyl carrier protein